MFALRIALRTSVSRPIAARAIATSAPRAMSKDSFGKGAVNYDDMKKFTLQPSNDVIVIDTREADQAANSPIPGAVNVPFSKIDQAFGKNAHAGIFQQEFSFPKPEFKQKLVFLDSTGKRSKAAAEAAQKGGYENVRSYGGGVNEYHQKQKEGK